MVFITVSFVITFVLIPRPYLTGFFTVATKRQTPARIWDCHYACTPEHTWDGQYHVQHTECLASWAVAVRLKAHSALEMLTVGGASPLGANSAYLLGLTDAGQTLPDSPACHSILASDAGSSVSLHCALITKWKDTPTYRNTISAEHTNCESYFVN
jgi:hypothetical protein